MNLPPHYRIVLVYLLVGIAWIFFSDISVEYLFSGERVTQIQHFKGWAFVILTAAFLYVLIRHDFKAIQAANRKILDSIEQAVVIPPLLTAVKSRG